MRGLNAAIVLAVTLIVTSVCDAKTENLALGPSPLDRPLDELKAVLAKAGDCEWSDVGFKDQTVLQCHGRVENPDRMLNRGYWIHIDLTSDGSIDNIRFALLLGVPNGPPRYTGLREMTEDKAVVTALIAELFPNWAGSRAWMKKALHRALWKGFHTSIRVNGTSILVNEFQAADLDGHRAEVVLTKN